MTVLYVTSDQAGAGKTALCASLAQILGQAGKRATVFKPFSGAIDGVDPDAEIFGKLLGQSSEGWPMEIPKRGVTPKPLEKVKSLYQQVSQGADIVLVEGSSRLSLAESNKVAEALDARVLVVTRYRRDLVVSDLTPWRDSHGDRLAGFLINGLTRYLATEAKTGLLPALESKGLVSFGLVPEDRTLLSVTVRQLADHLEGRFIACEERSDALVQYLMVGGMSMDPTEAVLGHREDRAVIVRGDRPDIQMGALNNKTACLVLTKGIEPIEYVKYEAEQEEVSVMVVSTDTLATMDALNSLTDGARFDHPLKLETFVGLLEEHVDLPALLGALGVAD